MLELIQRRLEHLRVTKNAHGPALSPSAQAIHDAEWDVHNEMHRDLMELRGRIEALEQAQKSVSLSTVATAEVVPAVTVTPVGVGG